MKEYFKVFYEGINVFEVPYEGLNVFEVPYEGMNVYGFCFLAAPIQSRQTMTKRPTNCPALYRVVPNADDRIHRRWYIYVARY